MFSIRPRTYQAHLVIGGTKAHDITEDGAALALGGGTFAAVVHHPPTKPQHTIPRTKRGTTDEHDFNLPPPPDLALPLNSTNPHQHAPAQAWRR